MTEHQSNGFFSSTTRVIWRLMKQEMMGWQRHQLDHMQTICTSLQTDNHASTSSLIFTGRMLIMTSNQQCQMTLQRHKLSIVNKMKHKRIYNDRKHAFIFFVWTSFFSGNSRHRLQPAADFWWKAKHILYSGFQTQVAKNVRNSKLAATLCGARPPQNSWKYKFSRGHPAPRGRTAPIF